MDRILRICCILLMLVAISLPWHSRSAYAVVPPAYTALGPGDVYLALGDSLATGTEAAANNDNLPGYPATLLPSLQAINSQITYENLAVAGQTSTTMLNGGQLDAAILRIETLQAAGKQVGLVTLSIGGNDFLSVLPPTSADPNTVLAAFKTNYALILDGLLDALKDTNGVRQGDLIVMDYYNPYPGLVIAPFNIDALVATWLPQFNTAIKDIAAARGVPVAEVAQAVVGNEETLLYVARPYPISIFDLELERKLDYHPRPSGHKVIADAFLAVSNYPYPRYVYLPILFQQ